VAEPVVAGADDGDTGAVEGLLEQWGSSTALQEGRSKNVNSSVEINPDVAPSGAGCADCLAGAAPGWWLHLRRCADCGHIGCCDNSPAQHATAHSRETGHAVIRSFEPGEDWFYDYRTGEFFTGPQLAEPESHPPEQPVPGPAGKVPPDWQSQLR
jgi:hypothetical protein